MMYLKSILSISLLFVVFSTSYAQSAGYLDENFGDNGVVVTNAYNKSEYANAVALKSDGRIVIGGWISVNSDADLILAQYLENGSLDESFSDDGLFWINFPASDDYLNDIVVQEDGKIIFTGTTHGSDNSDIIVGRVNTDGSLDNTFSNDGMLVIDIDVYDFGRAVCLQDDGKILVAGYCQPSSGINLVLCRLNTDGTFDNTFGSNGKIIYDVNWESEDFMNDVVVYEGNIFVSGYIFEGFSNRTPGGVAVVKFDEEGTVMSDFGDDGLAFVELDAVYQVYIAGSKIAINQDGIYVAATRRDYDFYGDSDVTLINFLHNGYPNEEFGIHGVVFLEMVVKSDAVGIALQSDGKIITAGKMYTDYESTDSFVARFLPNGELDADFGEYYGVAIVDVSPGDMDKFNDVCLQDDHKIVACGDADFGDVNFSIARLYSGLEVGIPESNSNVFSGIDVRNPVVAHQLEMIFHLQEASDVEAQLFDINGRDLGTVFRESYEKGMCKKTVHLNTGLPQGIYIMQLTVNGERKSYRLIVQ